MEEVSRLQIWTKIRKILTYLLLVFCATSFYSHKFIAAYDDDLLNSKKEYEEAKAENTIALSKVKTLAIGTKEYENYKKVSLKKKKAHSVFVKKLNNNKFLVFKSFQHFIERFGLIFCVFIYALYNLIKSYLRERKNFGAKAIHLFIISVCFNYFFWIFQKFQDFSKITYILMTLVSAFLVVIGVSLITKYNVDRNTKLRSQLYRVAKLGLVNVKPEEKENLIKDFKEIAQDK